MHEPDPSTLPPSTNGPSPPAPPAAPPSTWPTLEGAASPPRADIGATRPDWPRVPGYEILGVLGRGGMGVVYKARQIGLNRVVALKMILHGEHAGPDLLARFRLEAEVVGQLRHPNIVQVHEVGEAQGQPYFSLEFMEGGSLANRPKSQARQPAQAARLVETLARAMHAVHERGVIHRDLKPANVLLAADGTPKIADFGLAKRLGQDAGGTGSGAILGTPAYMAPEQAFGKSNAGGLGPAVDVYALGAILYELLTGRPPFQADTPLDTVAKVLDEEPVAPSRLVEGVPRDLETICLKCLAKEPQRRYGDALDLAEDLRRFQASEPILARPVGRAERLLLWARRRPTQAALVGLAALVLVLGSLGGTAVWLWQDAERARQEASAARDRLAGEKRLTEEALRREGVAKRKAEEAFRLEGVAKRKAQQAFRGEREARRQVAEAKEKLAQVLYLRRISLAQAEWRDNEVARAEQLLQECLPEHRQWEWFYVYHLCHSEQLLLTGQTQAVHGVCVSPDGKRLASAFGIVMKGGGVRVWDAATGRQTLYLPGHTHPVTSVCFSPDGKRLASASKDKTVRVWDAATGRQALNPNWHTNPVYSVCFSPDGKRLASASFQVVRVWDAVSGEQALTLKGHTGAVTSVCFSPDGKCLASASADETVRVWDAATGQLTLTLQGHNAEVTSVCFSPDARRLASASEDGTVRVWDAATGQLALTLKGHTGGVTSVCFSPDGKRLASASYDKTVRVWDGTPPANEHFPVARRTKPSPRKANEAP